jgi:SAM-dependent methyltransferase
VSLSTPSDQRVAAVDRHLTAACRELFAHDDRLRGMRIDVRFDGGVAHVSGELGSHSELALCKELIGRLAGVLAVWDWVRVDGREPVVLDIGCGDTKQHSSNLGVDLRATDAVDVLGDLSDGLPFATASVDGIFAVHVLEHLIDFLPLVDECHRVLRPHGVLHVLSPWWRHVNAVADPTHVRLLDVQTFKGICKRPGQPRTWQPLHCACDGATVFADLAPLHDADPDRDRLARFFD